MSFDTAYERTLQFEGGYSNNPSDKGGETYAGIARNYHKSWEGWKIVDRIKKLVSRSNLNSVLKQDRFLQEAVKSFYMKNFWLQPKFDTVDKISPAIAEKIYDIGVNMGTSRPVKWLQEALNLLNRNGKKYANIAVDGKLGPKTCSTLQEALKCNSEKRILTVIAIMQGSFYIERMQKDASQRVFVGWFDRVF